MFNIQSVRAVLLPQTQVDSVILINVFQIDALHSRILQTLADKHPPGKFFVLRNQEKIHVEIDQLKYHGSLVFQQTEFSIVREFFRSR